MQEVVGVTGLAYETVHHFMILCRRYESMDDNELIQEFANCGGRPAVMTPVKEKMIVDRILVLDSHGWAPSPDDIRRIEEKYKRKMNFHLKTEYKLWHGLDHYALVIPLRYCTVQPGRKKFPKQTWNMQKMQRR